MELNTLSCLQAAQAGTRLPAVLPAPLTRAYALPQNLLSAATKFLCLQVAHTGRSLPARAAPAPAPDSRLPRAHPRALTPRHP